MIGWPVAAGVASAFAVAVFAVGSGAIVGSVLQHEADKVWLLETCPSGLAFTGPAATFQIVQRTNLWGGGMCKLSIPYCDVDRKLFNSEAEYRRFWKDSFCGGDPPPPPPPPVRPVKTCLTAGGCIWGN